MAEPARQPMSGEQENVAPAPEEREARLQGWSPKDQWRGDEKDWIDAPTFLKQAKKINPILRANNRKLEEQVQALNRKLEEQNELIKQSSENIEALKNFNSEQVKEQAKRLRKQLVIEIKAAREAGDVEREEDLRSQLGDQDAAIREAEKPAPKPEEKKPDPPKTPELSPAVKAFVAENDWFNTDSKKRALFVQSMQDLAAAGKLDGISEAERLRMAKEETESFLGERKVIRRPSDVASGQGGSGRQSSGGKTFADLPRHYQKACDKWAKDLVGPNKNFKTLDDYRKHYVSQIDFNDLEPDPNA